tara:strand:- start:61 stop:633 length:573 start_codon:yes stop_codon:yes gene_type:complete
MIEVYNTFTPHACRQLINQFNADDNKKPGTTGDDKLKPEWKQSTDLGCNFDHDATEEYNKIIRPGLLKAMNLYVEKYYVLKTGANFYVDPTYNIQHYKDGEGYAESHIEYMPWPNTNFMYRMLAWMINLNDAECGTEFLLQNQILLAQQGNVSIWPAYWTHHHRGVCPNIGDKYIATGWCLYTPFKASDT